MAKGIEPEFTDSVSKDVLKAAKEVYHLEHKMNDLDKDALSAAITAGIRKHEETVKSRMAEIAISYAAELEDEGNEVPGSVALRWFADKLKKEIPNATATDKYYPREDDRVEVIMIGDVSLEEEECAECGHMNDDGVWCVTTDIGKEHFFDLKETMGTLKVRVLYRPDDNEE